MAIFIKDLESIEINNKKNLVKTEVDSDVIHFINYQNTDDELSDLNFELDINFRKSYDKNRFFFRKLKTSPNVSFDSIESLFKGFNAENKIIFESLEQIISIINEEEKIRNFSSFLSTSSYISNEMLLKKKNLASDVFINFLVSIKNLKESDVFQNFVSAQFTNTNKLFNDYITENKNNLTKTIQSNNFFKNLFKDNHLLFVKNFLGFNFIDIDNDNFIQGNSKPYTLLSLTAAVENILQYSFDDMSTNSLFYGFYTNDELSKKYNFSKNTNNIYYEHDVTKEILPIKYINNYNLITKERIKSLIDSLNILNAQQDRIITQKNADENIDKSLFHTATDINIFNIQQNTNVKQFSKMLDFLDDEQIINQTATQKGLKSAIIAENVFVEDSKTNPIHQLRTHKYKTKKSVLQALNLICSNINSKKVKLMYCNTQQLTNNSSGKINTNFIKYHDINDINNTGIFNFDLPYMVGSKSNETISSILRNRLLSNNIVKKYKKIKMNNNLDSSQNVSQNKLQFLLNSSQISKDAGSKSIGWRHNTPTDLDFISSIKRKMGVSANSVNEILKLLSSEYHLKNIFHDNELLQEQITNNTFKKIDKNILNQQFFFKNNKILGENNLPDYLQFTHNFINLNNQLINETIYIDEQKITEYQRENIDDLGKLSGFTQEYYNDSFQIFKSTSIFFESINEICQEYIQEMQKISEQDPDTYPQSSLHADLLQTAVIFKYFLDSSKQDQNNTDLFNEDFVNFLMMDMIVSKNNQSNHKLQFFEKYLSIFSNLNNKIFNQEMITSVAPFHIFFMNEEMKVQTTDGRVRRSQSTKNLDLIANNGRDENYNSLTNINIYETNGLFTHFVNTDNTPVETNMLFDAIIDNELTPQAKRIPLAGYHILENYIAPNSPEYRRYVLFIPTIKPTLNGYTIEMYINFKANNELSNQYITSNYTLKESQFKYATSNLYSPVINQQNSSINKTLKSKNIFNKISSLFESLITTQISNNTNLNTLLNNNLNEEIVDIKKLLQDTLLIAGEIYLNMFYKLQGYTNVSNRIHMSNILNARWPYQKNHTRSTAREMYSYFYHNRRRKNDKNSSETISGKIKYNATINNIVMNEDNIQELNEDYLATGSSIYKISRLDSLTQKFHSNNRLFSSDITLNFGSDNISLKKMLYLFNEIFFDLENENSRKLSINILRHLLSQNIQQTKVNPQNVFTQVTTDVFSSYHEMYYRDPNSQIATISLGEYISILDSNINIFELFDLTYNKTVSASYDDGDPFRIFASRDKLIYRNYTNLSGIILDRNTVNLNTFNLIYQENDFSNNVYLEIKENLRNIIKFEDPSKKIQFITPSKVFNSLIHKSYIFKNYDYTITKQDNQNYYGSNNIETAESNNLGLSQLYSAIKPERIQSTKIDNINFIDINESWYHHIILGLLINDVSLSMLFDYLIFFKGDFFNSFKSFATVINQIRRSSEQIANVAPEGNNSGLTSVINAVKKRSLNKNNEKFNNVLYFNQNNTKIKNLYFQYLQKYKMTQNIVDLCQDLRKAITQNHSTDSNRDVLIEKIIKNDESDSNSELFFNYFDDFFLKKNQNDFYPRVNNIYHYSPNNNTVATQSKFLNGSHIFTVGFKNEDNVKFDMDDILSVKVELIDHDFPEIVWEPKIFEFHASLENPDNIVITYYNLLFDKVINPLTLFELYNDESIPLKIFNTNRESEPILKTNAKSNSFKDALIKKSDQKDGNIDQYPNFKNNINSKTYTDINQGSFKSIINPIDFHNDTAYIVNRIGIANVVKKIVSHFNRYNQFGNTTQILEAEKIGKAALEMLKRCIHNQRISFKLQKMIKLISGFEPTTDFSFNDVEGSNITFSQRDALLGKYILKEIYDIYIGNITNFNNYDFTKEEVDALINKNSILINGKVVYKVLISEKHSINVFLKFLSDFSKALMHENMLLLGNLNSFEKIVNIAVNPKDFIVAGFKGSGVRDFVPVSPELEFIKINQDGIYYDEIMTEPNYILRLLTDFTIDNEKIDYYRVYKKSDNTLYIPKNVSYRISTTILK